MPWWVNARRSFRLRKLRSPIRMQDTTGHVATHPDRVLQRRYCQLRLHSGVDRVPHDASGVGVLDRAEVELALAGVVLGDVGQPQPVRHLGCETRAGPGRVRRSWCRESSWTAGPGFFRFCHASSRKTLHQPLSDAIVHAVRSAIGSPASRPRRREAGTRTRDHPDAHRTTHSPDMPTPPRCVRREPPTTGNTADEQAATPARHRDGNPVRGQLAHERVEPFPGRFACDRYAAAVGAPRLPAPGAGYAAAAHGPRRTRHACFRTFPVVHRSATHPLRQRHRVNTEVGGDLLDRHSRLTIPSDNGQRRRGTPAGKAWARWHPSRPTHRASQIKCHLSCSRPMSATALLYSPARGEAAEAADASSFGRRSCAVR